MNQLCLLMRTLWAHIPFRKSLHPFLHVWAKGKMVLFSKHGLLLMPLQIYIKHNEIIFLVSFFSGMCEFLTPSKAELWYWPDEFMHTYLRMCVFLANCFFNLANCITPLRAKSLTAEIKQLCFVVMVHKILFKARLLSRKPTKKRTKENRGSALRVQYPKQAGFVPTLITINQNLLEQNTACLFQTSFAYSL